MKNKFENIEDVYFTLVSMQNVMWYKLEHKMFRRQIRSCYDPFCRTVRDSVASRQIEAVIRGGI